MFLSDRDLHTALNEKRLIVEPRPTKIDPTSIDLSLDRVEEAKIWNVEKLIQHQQTTGNDNPEVRIGNYNYSKFSTEFLISPPDCSDGCTGQSSVKRLVFELFSKQTTSLGKELMSASKFSSLKFTGFDIRLPWMDARGLFKSAPDR